MTDFFEKLLKSFNEEENNGIMYQKIDFHDLTKETDYSKIDPLIYGVFGSTSGVNLFEIQKGNAFI